MNYAEIQKEFPVGSKVDIAPIGECEIKEYQVFQVMLYSVRQDAMAFVPTRMFIKYMEAKR